MVENEGLGKLFFELASESRLGILQILKKENLKMQEIARRLDITATEAFRQLERLSAASLVQRQPDGAFTLAPYGRLMLQLSASLEFASKHREYFSTHDLMVLPPQLLNRLGELAGATLNMDTVENLNRSERALLEAEEFSWGIAEGTIPQHMEPLMVGQLQKGVKMRFIIPENRLATDAGAPMPKNLEAKSLPVIPAIVVLTEKVAGVSFRQIGGRVDYAGFFGTDVAFHAWVKDLFLYYWDRAKRA
jgi:predicted transcriptional regulator